jgi:polyhydroxybutyrate depolymerase
MPRSRVSVVLVFLAAVGCRVHRPRDIHDTLTPSPLPGERAGVRGPSQSVLRTLGGRDYALDVPPAASLGKPLPLILLLHGYGSSGQGQSDYFGLDSQVAKRGFLLAKPDGTRDGDGSGRRYWNAFFPDCCASGADSPMACDHAETFAGVVALAGAVDPGNCHPSQPVSVAAVHGTDDRVIEIEGGRTGLGPRHPYASLADTVGVWVRADRCARPPAPVRRDDLVSNDSSGPQAIPGPETVIERASGCAGGTDVEAWKIEGAGHVPSWNDQRWPAAALDFLLAHRRAPPP